MRLKHTYKERTARERVEYWWFYVRQNAWALWDSLWEIPPKLKDHFEGVKPGEEGYEDAGFEWSIDHHPMRFDLKKEEP